MFDTVTTRLHHWTLSWSVYTQFKSSHCISLRSTLISSSHLCIGLKDGVFPEHCGCDIPSQQRLPVLSGDRRIFMWKNVHLSKNAFSGCRRRRDRMAPTPPLPVTEDTPPDMLAGSMDLRVVLPNGHSVKMSVDRRWERTRRNSDDFFIRHVGILLKAGPHLLCFQYFVTSYSLS